MFRVPPLAAAPWRFFGHACANGAFSTDTFPKTCPAQVRMFHAPSLLPHPGGSGVTVQVALRFPTDTVSLKTPLRPGWDVPCSTAAAALWRFGRDCTGGIAFPADAVSKNASRPNWDVSRSIARCRLWRFGRDRISASLPRALFPKRALPGWDASRSIAGRRTLLALLQVWPRLSGSGVTAQAMCSLCARRLRERALSPATGATNRRLPCPDGSLEITAQAMLHSPARRFQKRATYR